MDETIERIYFLRDELLELGVDVSDIPEPNKKKSTFELASIRARLIDRRNTPHQRPTATATASIFSQQFAFSLAVCKCSRRTAKEEELYGSYCSRCWNVIRCVMKCRVCGKGVEEERLYVCTNDKVYCRKCF
jgi:hypothetical protein